MRKIIVVFLILCAINYSAYSQMLRYNQPISDTNSIVFADTIQNIVTDSLEHNIGIVPQTRGGLTKYFKYTGVEDVYIRKPFTSDPHFICEYPKEPLVSGKIYSFEVCFTHINRLGCFNKSMGFILSNDSVIIFRFTGEVTSSDKDDSSVEIDKNENPIQVLDDTSVEQE